MKIIWNCCCAFNHNIAFVSSHHCVVLFVIVMQYRVGIWKRTVLSLGWLLLTDIIKPLLLLKASGDILVSPMAIA